jgi:hypothetical protein
MVESVLESVPKIEKPPVGGCKLQKLKWPGTELNRRHADFQSAALPTELPGRDLKENQIIMKHYTLVKLTLLTFHHGENCKTFSAKQFNF